jgi:pimeloyl-ACP methyl ester carboxylesterase
MARENAATLDPQLLDPLPQYGSHAARQISCPALLVGGEKSPQMCRDTVDVLQAWMPDSKRMTIQGASHGMTASHASVLNALAREFWSPY